MDTTTMEPGTTFTLEILTKAVDWLFREAGEILAERRKRRQTSDKVPTKKETEYTTEAEVKRWVPDDGIYSNSKVRIKRIFELIEIQTNNRDRCRRQVMQQGGPSVASAQAIAALEAAEDELFRLAQELKTTLEQIYKRPININD